MVVLLFTLTLFIYLKTLLHYPLGGDIGELQTAALTLGIAHPPGYPTYILLGKLLSLLIPFGSPAAKINLLSAVSSTLTSLILFLIVKKLTKNKTLAFLIALAFTLTQNIWYYSIVSEPYLLATLFSAAIIYLSLAKTNPLATISLLFSLSLGVHLQTIVILPPVLFYLFLSKTKIFKNPQNIFLSLLLFLLGLSTFLYLPIRARQNPPINYNNPVNLEKFKELITASQFRGLAFSSHKQNAFTNHLENVFQDIKKEYTPLIFLPFFLGIFFLIKKSAQFLLFLGGLLLSLFVWADYAVSDFTRYFQTFYLLFLIIAGLGCNFLLNLSPRKFFSPTLLIILALLPLSLFLKNYPLVDQSKNNQAYLKAKETLSLLEPNAVLLSYWQESGIYWYLTFVEKYRSDVAIIDDRNMINIGLKSYRQTADYFLNQKRPFYTLKGFNRVNEAKGERKTLDLGQVVQILP